MEDPGAFVGRIQQRAQLARWLTAARDGQPSVVLLEGPPGIGKSALVEWIVLHAETQRVEALHVQVPDLGAVTSAALNGYEWGLGLADDLLGGGGTRLLAIDDAHWLDDAGLRVVQHLAFRLGTASLTGQPARVFLVVVVRDGHQHLVDRLGDEPITRRLLLPPLDDREIRELARQRAPFGSEPRAVARLAELSGGNPLTLHALSAAVGDGERMPSAKHGGTIPVEVAWRARLATLDQSARRAAAAVALLDPSLLTRAEVGTRFAGFDAGLEELARIGAVHVVNGSWAFAHPLLRTTALDVVEAGELVDIARSLLDNVRDLPDAARATLVRLSAAAGSAETSAHRDIVGEAADEAWEAHSWSVCADHAEFMVSTASDDRDRAEWLERVGKARFNELDRDEATTRLGDAAEALEICAAQAQDPEARAVWRARRAQCLLLALRADFTRRGPRRRPELDAEVERLIDDDDLEPQWRAQAASILAEISFLAPTHDRRRSLVDAGQRYAAQSDDTLTRFFSNFAAGLHHFAVLDLAEADRSFSEAHRAAVSGGHGWWQGPGSARRALIAMARGDPMAAIAHASVAADESTRWANWAEHGQALAVRASAQTRLGRFADADSDSESALLSARRADAGFVAVATIPTTTWRRAVRADADGVDEMLVLAERHQVFMPFAAYVASIVLHGAGSALELDPPRWLPPRRALEARNLGFHLAQLEAAWLAGNREILETVALSLREAWARGARYSIDWPTGVAAAIATAEIELGGPGADEWLQRSKDCAIASGSTLDGALHAVSLARHQFQSGRGDQTGIDAARTALAAIDGLGAPLLARLQRERLTAVTGRLGMPGGRIRTVMFTDIVDSTRLMAAAGNAAWATLLFEHHRIVRNTVARHQGTVMTSTGDGFSAWFEHPHDAVEASRALHQAIALADLAVSGGGVPGGVVGIRVGLASGPVFDIGGDASGLAVAEAARVMSTAGSGAIHLSASVIEHGLPQGYARSLGTFELKGLPQAVEVFVLDGPERP